MGIDRLDERRAIAAKLDDAQRARELVNTIPEVRSAREASSAADEVARAANAVFRKLFNANYPREEDVVREIRDGGTDVVVLGDTDTPWIARCAVSGLPIFRDDLVYLVGGDEDYQRTYVLAAAVSVDAALGLDEPVIAGTTVDEDDDEEPDESDDAAAAAAA